MNNKAAIEQPAPIKNDGLNGLDIHSLVIRDIEDRRKAGIERYGIPLQAHNGRDALVHAYQEALDLCCYLRQCLFERDSQ